MGKPQALDDSDLVPVATRRNGTPQRTTPTRKEPLEPIQFRLPRSVARAFKMRAAAEGIMLNELLQAAFSLFEQNREAGLALLSEKAKRRLDRAE